MNWGLSITRVAVHGLGGHEFSQRVQAGLRDIGIGQRVALVLQDDVGDHPAVAATSDDLVLGHPHVGEEHLVEIALHGHVDQRPDLDARGVHPEQQETDAAVLGGVGLGANQAEDPVGQMRGAGPDLLTIDDPLIAIEHSTGAQAGQIAAGAGFGIPLAPDGVAAQGGRDELALLGLGADFQQRGHQHRDALSPQAGADPRTGEFLGDDARFRMSGSRPAPPYSLGMVRAAYPCSISRRCQALDFSSLGRAMAGALSRCAARKASTPRGRPRIAGRCSDPWRHCSGQGHRKEAEHDDGPGQRADTSPSRESASRRR
jgi:hypothetical protein